MTLQDQYDEALALAEEIFGNVHLITSGRDERRPGAIVAVYHCKSGAIVRLQIQESDNVEESGVTVNVSNTSTKEQALHFIRRWLDSVASHRRPWCFAGSAS